MPFKIRTMAAPPLMSSPFLLLLPFLFFLSSSSSHVHSPNNPLPLPPIRHRSRLFSTSLLQDTNQTTPPTLYFEVAKPISPPPGDSLCASQSILHHDFAYTYNQPPVTALYTPPTNCPDPADWSAVVLEFSSTCKGRQYDRIFGIWVGRVEVLRSCTAEPRATGIFWKVEKDVTRYSSLLRNNQTVAVYLQNIVDSTYTGIYHVNLTFHFYARKNHVKESAFVSNLNLNSPADLILPVSRSPALGGGYWFSVENSTDVESKEVSVPKNTYRAVLEVYVSNHGDDEFWYTNPPNEYLLANNLSTASGNGAFREVVVKLDDKVIGAFCPYTVIYTGGINPLLWRPITGIGSFDLPSYDIEVTPFLGELLGNNKSHSIEFMVTEAVDVWYIDANLHLWLDNRIEKVQAKLLRYEAPEFGISLMSDFKGLNGVFNTNASRYVSAVGSVRSSYGEFVTYSIRRYWFSNLMKFSDDGNSQVVNQTIHMKSGVRFKLPKSTDYFIRKVQTFPLYVFTVNVDEGNGTLKVVTDVSLEFDEYILRGEHPHLVSTSLTNRQDSQGYMIAQNNLLTSGFGSTKEVYKYDSDRDCYLRNVSSTNYTINYDYTSGHCSSRRLWI